MQSANGRGLRPMPAPAPGQKSVEEQLSDHLGIPPAMMRLLGFEPGPCLCGQCDGGMCINVSTRWHVVNGTWEPFRVIPAADKRPEPDMGAPKL